MIYFLLGWVAFDILRLVRAMENRRKDCVQNDT